MAGIFLGSAVYSATSIPVCTNGVVNGLSGSSKQFLSLKYILTYTGEILLQPDRADLFQDLKNGLGFTRGCGRLRAHYRRAR